jgi:putative flippase GtrA
MVVNYAVTMYSSVKLPDSPIQVAALIGIAAGTVLNFIVNQFLVFRRRMNHD